MDNAEVLARIEGLVIFRGLLDDPVVSRFRAALASMESRGGGVETMGLVAQFESELFAHGTNWTRYLLKVVLENENTFVLDYVKAHNEGRHTNPVLEQSALVELAFLGLLGSLGLADLLAGLPASQQSSFSFLPQWETEDIDFAAEYTDRIKNISTAGYGIFSRYDVFTVENATLVPVKHPDARRLEQLPGYEREREKIIENTEALLKGLPANNILLYGDAGTGKSSAIKAIANEYASQGLRLVEVKKNQLYELPDIMESLAANPLKFIIFIDDLSFTSNDTEFTALKAILEGSVCGRAANIAVYATSNRRHLVKETLEDRQGSDIHEQDTRQELMSLSTRFGLVITFMKPDRKRFADILTELVRQEGVEGDFDELLQRAEAFAIRAGGRSPRAARQFVDLLKAGVNV